MVTGHANRGEFGGHRDTIARYLRRLATRRREIARGWDQKGQGRFAEMERQWADRCERLADAAERGPWPPDWAHLCIQCISGQDPEEGRCPTCDTADCCAPSGMECEVCYETYCPDCLRWVPNCQRGLWGEPKPPWVKALAAASGDPEAEYRVRVHYD